MNNTLKCDDCGTEREPPPNELTTQIIRCSNCWCSQCREITRHTRIVPLVEIEKEAA